MTPENTKKMDELQQLHDFMINEYYYELLLLISILQGCRAVSGLWAVVCTRLGRDGDLKVHHHHPPTLALDLLLELDVSLNGSCQLKTVTFIVPQSSVTSTNLTLPPSLCPVGGFCVSATPGT